MAVYRAHNAAAHIAASTAVLHAHRLDLAFGRCAACGESAPCETANAAFAQLARYGITTAADWSDEPTVALCPPAARRAWQSPLLTLLGRRRVAARGWTPTEHATDGPGPRHRR
jgi:hypothetical protein